MAKVDRSKLVRGDVLLFEWIDGTWHTAIYNGSNEIVHCEGATHGTAIDPMAEYYGTGKSSNNTKNLFAFRPPTTHGDGVTDVMLLANQWALKTTGYGKPRGSAVLKEYDKLHPEVTPPFEYDALFRVFKWLDGREKFSKSHGTTCCAFVIACYQAGLMKHYLDDKGIAYAIREIQEKLRKERGSDKRPNDEKLTKTFREEQITRGNTGWKSKPVPDEELKKVKARKVYSNLGSSKEGVTVDALWAEILAKDCYREDLTDRLEDVLTSPLFCDAKFTYSRTLYQRLSGPKGWTPVRFNEE